TMKRKRPWTRAGPLSTWGLLSCALKRRPSPLPRGQCWPIKAVRVVSHRRRRAPDAIALPSGTNVRYERWGRAEAPLRAPRRVHRQARAGPLAGFRGEWLRRLLADERGFLLGR